MPGDHFIGRTLGGRYRLLTRLDRGGMGVVYVAVDDLLQRSVVVKFVRPDDDANASTQRFENETRIAAQLTHPNIVAIHDAGADDLGDGAGPRSWFVMELLTGEPLSAAIHRGLDITDATRIVEQVARALAHAHGQGVVHRDLKPANIFLTGDRSVAVKVLDFGLARRIEDPSITLTGELIGTPGYMSPEQIDGRDAVDGRADLYALGVLWYEMLTGENPFRRDTAYATLVQHTEGKRPEPPSSRRRDIPGEVDDLVMHLLARDPSRRTLSALALLADLQALALPADGPLRVATESTRRSSRPSAHREPAWWPLAAACVVCFVGAIGVAVASTDPPDLDDVPLTVDVDSLSRLGDAPSLDGRVVNLGRRLYFSPILSTNGRVSCSTCHPFETGGTTREPQTRLGVSGEAALFNTPSVFNAGLAWRQAWRADAERIEDVIRRPLTNPTLMGAQSLGDIVARLTSEPDWARAFGDAGLVLNETSLLTALATYVRFIVPRGAPFDDPDPQAESPTARAGAKLFTQMGCAACHQGRGVGGNMRAKFGVMVGDPYADRGRCDDDSYCRSDEDCQISGGGRCGADSNGPREVDRGADPKNPDAKYVFRVPSLRNVAVTAPYFHDGSARTLDEAVRTMARLQLGRTLTPDEVGHIVAFLESLTGTINQAELTRAAAAAAAGAQAMGAP